MFPSSLWNCAKSGRRFMDQFSALFCLLSIRNSPQNKKTAARLRARRFSASVDDYLPPKV
jgi:hypothetical protein